MEEYGNPLTDNDINEILKQVREIRPADLDEKLFNSTLDNIVSKRIVEIRGVEDRPQVKAWLQKREFDETTQAARLKIKIPFAEQQEKFFPSAYNDALPKFYTDVERKDAIQTWIKILQSEMIAIFEIEGVKTEEPSGAIIPKETIEDDSKLKELPLTEEQIQKALDVLDYSLFYRGDRENVKIDYNVSMVANRALKRVYENRLRAIRIRPTRAEKYIEMFQLRFMRSLAIPGKFAGNIAASSFGQSATQQSLNTFHFAGDKNARKQVAGFAKFESIIAASDSAQTIATIFLKPIKRFYNGELLTEILNGEQMRMRIPEFQMTTLSDIIEDYRILGDVHRLPKAQRWELVNDAVKGIDYYKQYGPNDRIRIHRYNSSFNQRQENGKGPRILEIKFKIEELYFRRISLGQIADAIEEISSKVRVVTSSLDIGLIYVFYEFTSISQEVRKEAETLPEQAFEDPFTFFLKKVYYPSIQSLQIGGIYGIDYLAVKNFSIPKALDDFNSIFNSGTKRMYLKFKNNDVYYWGLTPEVIENFITIKLRRFMPPGFNLNLARDEDEVIYSFNTEGLEWYDYTDNTVKPLYRKEIWDELQNKTRIPIYELLKHPPGARYKIGSGTKGEGIYDDLVIIHNSSNLTQYTNPLNVIVQQPVQPIVEQESSKLGLLPLNQINLFTGFSAMALNGNDVLKSTITQVEKNTIVLEFDEDKMDDLGFDLQSVAKVLEGVFSFANTQSIQTSVDDKNNKILLRGIDPGDMSLEAFVEQQLKECYDVSDVIDECTLRWYFEAEGQNLAKILAHPDVDAKYTRSDNPVEMFQVLGVEACRSSLIKEIAENVKQDLNPVHIELLADSMTFRTPGDKPLAQNRNGLNKRHAQFISRAFEKTVSVFMEAGLGEVDNLRSFPAKIMWGVLKDNGVLAEDARIRDLQKGIPLASIYENQSIFKYDFPPEPKPQPSTKETEIIKAVSIQEELEQRYETENIADEVVPAPEPTVRTGGIGKKKERPKISRRPKLKKK